MPPKSKSSSEELTEALLDPKIAESIAKALSPCIAQSIDAAVEKRIEVLTNSVTEIKEENARLGREVMKARAESERFKRELGDQAVRLKNLKAYSRSDNIVIHGLPEMSAAERASSAAMMDDPLTESQGTVEATVISFSKTRWVSKLGKVISLWLII